jgi:hypothetical protein
VKWLGWKNIPSSRCLFWHYIWCTKPPPTRDKTHTPLRRHTRASMYHGPPRRCRRLSRRRSAYNQITNNLQVGESKVLAIYENSPRPFTPTPSYAAPLLELTVPNIKAVLLAVLTVGDVRDDETRRKKRHGLVYISSHRGGRVINAASFNNQP